MLEPLEALSDVGLNVCMYVLCLIDSSLLSFSVFLLICIGAEIPFPDPRQCYKSDIA
jgi:hypothetical protein